MKAYAYLKYARISPRKVKIVLDLIRGKDAGTAMAILKNTHKGASEYLIKLLGSAIANAENNFHMDSTKLDKVLTRSLVGVLEDRHSGSCILTSDEVENDLYLTRGHSRILKICICFHFLIPPLITYRC